MDQENYNDQQNKLNYLEIKQLNRFFSAPVQIEEKWFKLVQAVQLIKFCLTSTKQQNYHLIRQKSELKVAVKSRFITQEIESESFKKIDIYQDGVFSK